MTTTATAASDAAQTGTQTATDGASTDTASQATATGAAGVVESSAEPGDAGKRAIDAMKAERNLARKELAAAKAEADRLKAAAEGREAEWKAEQDARAAADARFNERILAAEVKAAAAGKLADPADAHKFLDLSKFEIDADGNTDTAAIEAAIADLIKSKPYLAADATQRFQGSADAGARNATGPTQLTQEQLDHMTPDQIVKAQADGQLNDLLGITATK